MSADSEHIAGERLQRAVDVERDHARGGGAGDGVVTLVLYGDYLCPYCRRLRIVLAQLREALGNSFVYVFRHLPNEAIHPGADLLARATEAAAAQGRFWDMHDWLYAHEPPIDMQDVFAFVQSLGLDMERFKRDIDSEATRARVQEDLNEGRANGKDLTVKISGVKELSDTIKRSGLAPANLANFLGVGLAIAGKPGNIDGKPAVEVPITLSKGKVGVGGIALVAVPRLFQPE